MSKNPEVFIFSLFEAFNSIHDFCSIWGYYDLIQKLDSRYERQFIDSIIASRLGMTACTFNSDTSNIAIFLNQWQLSIEELSDKYYFEFIDKYDSQLQSKKLSRISRLVRNRKATNDPAKKLLNDWIIQIFYSKNSSENDRRNKLRDCEIFGIKVLMWYRNTFS